MFGRSHVARAASLVVLGLLSGCSQQASEQASKAFDLLCSVVAIDGALTRLPEAGFPVAYPKVGDQVRIRLSPPSEQFCLDRCSTIYSGKGENKNAEFHADDQEIKMKLTRTLAGRELPENYSSTYFLGTDVSVNRLNGAAVMQVRYRPTPTSTERTGAAVQILNVRAQCSKEEFTGFPKAVI